MQRKMSLILDIVRRVESLEHCRHDGETLECAERKVKLIPLIYSQDTKVVTTRLMSMLISQRRTWQASWNQRAELAHIFWCVWNRGHWLWSAEHLQAWNMRLWFQPQDGASGVISLGESQEFITKCDWSSFPNYEWYCFRKFDSTF